MYDNNVYFTGYSTCSAIRNGHGKSSLQQALLTGLKGNSPQKRYCLKVHFYMEKGTFIWKSVRSLQSTPVIADTLGTAILCPYSRESVTAEKILEN